MLLRNVVLSIHISLEGGEYARAREEGVAAVDLELEQLVVREAEAVRRGENGETGFGRDRKVLELLAEDNDGLLVEERVLEVRLVRRERVGELAGGALRWPVEGEARGTEEGEDKVEALRVELEGA